VADADVLFAAHRDRVFRYLRRFTGHGETARDLTQEVFLRVVRGPVPATDEEGRRAWIFRIARNLALNHVRDDRRRPSAAAPDLAHAATQEISAALREALDSLPIVDRDVFLLRETGGLSYDQIAAACDLTPAAVRSRLHRTRLQLRAALGPALPGARSPRGVVLTNE
jgi:RNA polymerase sigma-70 factor (ECF subfamily)